MPRQTLKPAMEQPFHLALLLALLLSFASALACQDAAPPVPPPSAPETEMQGTGGKPYRFTEDWFGNKIPHWTELLGELAGRPGIHYLEVGTYEGRSFLWVVDHILTHPTSRATGIDPFLGSRGTRARFFNNIAASGAIDRITFIEDFGEKAMKTLPEESFDLIYVDGGHASWTVFQQAALAWQLLKPGGIVIFDDYIWYKGGWPVELRPEVAVDAFLTAFRQETEIIYKGYDVFVRKVSRTCGDHYYCSSLNDQYIYIWPSGKLLDRSTGKEVSLALEEAELVRRALLATTTTMSDDAALRELIKKLQSQP